MAARETAAALPDALHGNRDQPLVLGVPALSVQAATREVRAASTRVTMTQVVVDGTGKPSGTTLSFDTDGEPHPLHGDGAAHQLVGAPASGAAFPNVRAAQRRVLRASRRT